MAPRCPVAEKRINLGYTPRAWQAECHRWLNKARFVVLALHRRAGKTELAIMELLDNALRCPKDLPHFAYIAPFRNQAKAIAWDRLKHYAHLVPGTEINESELWIRFRHNKAKIQVFGADNADAMRGLRFDGVVIDEFAQTKPGVWLEIIQPALSDRLGWALFIGTPHGINLFSDLFYKAKTLPDWFSTLYTVYDTDALDPSEVERLKRDMPDNEFAREYLCDFSASAEDQLISIGTTEAAAQRHMKPEDVARSARILGVDVARFGDDKSVIVRRQGLICFEPIVVSGMDNMTFAQRVAQEINDWHPDATFVDVGQGSGVIDRLRQLGHAITEINFGGRATRPEFVNKRTEMWWAVKEWIENGGCIPNLQGLKQDLASPTFSFNSKNQRCLESKDQIKARIMRSPDIADALALTFAYPVAAGMGHIHPSLGATSRALSDYDPYETAEERGAKTVMEYDIFGGRD